MKNIIIYSFLIVSIIVLLLSLRIQSIRVDYLEKKIESLENKIGKLNTVLPEPFKEYERILLNELINAPSVSIEAYEELIKQYKNTYWAHEAKKRIQNIKKRSIYWSKEKGWNLPLIDSITKANPEPYIISCPGC